MQIQNLPGLRWSNPAEVPQSPKWWLFRLMHRLSAEVDQLVHLDSYASGHHRLDFIEDPEVAEKFQRQINQSQSNFMRLVPEVEAERLRVEGLRLPDDSEPTDTDTWEIYQRNDLDFWLPVGFYTALVQRRAYWSVWFDDEDEGRARIAFESPQQVYVECEPGNAKRRLAAVKWWYDDIDEVQRANVYLPDRIHKFRRGMDARSESAWQDDGSEANPLGVVPIVAMPNKPWARLDGVSEIEDLIPVQDRINHTLYNRQVAEHLAAFRQKWATGIDIPIDEETGEPIDTYKAAIDKLWTSPDAETKFGQFEASDLTPYRDSITGDVEHISILSRTPRHVLTVSGQAPSGDALRSAEAGLVAKVRAFQKTADTAIREVLRLARLVEGKSTPTIAEVQWADPEFQTFAQLVDGHVKLVQAGVSSLNYAREKVGMRPEVIERVAREVEADNAARAELAKMMAPEPQPAEGSSSSASSSESSDSDY